MRSLKGKKRQKYKERFVSNNFKYEKAARQLLTPKTGYGLAAELRRAGVFVKTVVDKPQAADWAVKRQMQHSMARGIDWLLLVSDDSDFGEMIRRAREADLRTVVVGDGRTVLGRHADLWVPWMRVENGEVGDEVLRLGRRNVGSWSDEVGDGGIEGGSFLSASFYEGGDVDDELEGAAEEIVVRSSARFSGDGGGEVSAFSEEEALDEAYQGDDLEEDIFGVFGSALLAEDDLLSDSDDEDDIYI